MTKIKDKTNNFIVIIVTLTFIIICLLFLSLLVTLNNNLGKSEGINKEVNIITVANNIMVKCSNGNQSNVNLPKKFNSNHSYSYDFKVPKQNGEEKLYIYVNASYLTFKIFSKQECIYQSKANDTKIVKSGGYISRFIQIPEQYSGENLTIEFKSNVNSNFGINIPSIIIGSQSALLMHLYNKNLWLYAMTAILLVFSTEGIVLALTLFFYKQQSKQIFFISFFAFCIGVYLVSRSISIYVLFNSDIFVYIMDYIFFMITPIALIITLISIFQNEKSNRKQYFVLQICTIVLIVNMLIQSLLTLSTTSEFMKMQKITHIIYAIIFIIAFILPFTLKNKKIPKIKFCYFLHIF